MFNYIIPIFNKQDILPLTLDGIDQCASRDARIYTIIDGCTDGSEGVVDDFIRRTKRDVVKLHMPNVHMLRSVNAALKLVTGGFTIVSQDDIIFKDRNLESKIKFLYEKMGDRLGVISLRLGANVRPTPILRRLRLGVATGMMMEYDFIKSGDDHYPCEIIAEYEQFYPRVTAINGPNVIPWSVRSKVGLLDENLAPYGFDDPEYCLRSMQAGFVNGVFPLRYESDIAWGGTRRSKSFLQEVAKIHRRNRIYIWKKHGAFIEKIWGHRSLMSSKYPVHSIDKIIHQLECR